MKKKIAVFSTGWCAEIFSQFVSGMSDALKEERADIFTFLCYPTYIDTTAMKQGEMNIFDLPDIRDFDGVVIFGSGLDFMDRLDSIISRCKEAGVPYVIQGKRIDGCNCVISDNYQATRDLAAHLKEEHGVKDIIFFAGTQDSHDSEARLNAVRDYLRENDCEEYLREVFYTKWENAAANRRITELFASGEKLPDAFICANDGLAMATCLALSDNGCEVPGDVLVTGYDHIDDGKVFDPSVASVDQCFEDMGKVVIDLLRELIKGTAKAEIRIVPSKFIPGESCNCYECRDSDKVRRRVGREAFNKRVMTTYFNRKLDIIDSTILACLTYQDFKHDLHSLLVANHDYEGDSFQLLLEPGFGLSIYDSNIKLNTHGYSRMMEIIYSTEDGVPYEEELFDTRKLIPGYTGEGDNHLYIFLPLHESDSAYGYLVFRDCLKNIENRFVHIYQNRMSLVLDKFSHAITLDQINKRLMDLMRRDPLTNVSNRMAFEDKERFLQSQINNDPNAEFAVVMFDVNSLKLINDSFGHEAGDAYLMRACHLICNVFKHSPVYRIGGDEFVAVLSGEDYQCREELLQQINTLMSPYSNELPLPPDYVSVACGISVFDRRTDVFVADVIKRADEAMYKDKSLKKSKV